MNAYSHLSHIFILVREIPMGLRQKINSRPFLGYGLAGALVIFAVTMTLRSHVISRPRIILSNKAYFSADDGKSWFIDSVANPSPFRLQDGREAVLAHVFTLNGHDLFLGYLERGDGGNGPAKVPVAQSSTAVFLPGPPASRVVKRPGETTWLPMISSGGLKIMNVRGPDGALATQVQPSSDSSSDSSSD
jgi:hypothetical protein